MSNMIRLYLSWTFLESTHLNWLICSVTWFGSLSGVWSDIWHDLSKRSWSCYCHHQWSGRRMVSFIRKHLLWWLSMKNEEILLSFDCLSLWKVFKMLSVKHLPDAWSVGAWVKLLLNRASCLPFKDMISKTIPGLPVSCHRSIGCPAMSGSAPGTDFSAHAHDIDLR